MMFAAAIEADTTLSTKSPEARALAAKLMQKYDRDRNGKVSPSRPPSPARVVAPPPPRARRSRAGLIRSIPTLHSRAPFPRPVPTSHAHATPCPRHPMPTLPSHA